MVGQHRRSNSRASAALDRARPLFEAARLDRDPQTAQRLYQMLDDAPEPTLGWWEFLLSIPPKLRPVLVEQLEMNRRFERVPSESHSDLIEMAADVAEPRAFAGIVDGILTLAARGAHRSIVEHWLEMRWYQNESLPVDEVSPDMRYPARRAEMLAGGTCWNDAWHLCARSPGVEEFFDHPFWDALPRVVREECFGTFLHSVDGPWAKARDRWYRIAEVMQQIPAADWENIVRPSEWFEEFDDLHALFPRVVALRIRGGSQQALVRRVFLALPKSTRPRFLELTGRGFRMLERACRWSNDETLIEDGLCRLAEADADLLIAAWTDSPKQLFEVSRTIGSFRGVHAQQLLRQSLRHELFGIREASLTLVGLDNLLNRYRAWALRLPAYEKWDKHFAGYRVLKPHVVEALAVEMRAGVARFRLWAIEEYLLASLGEVPDRHAALLRLQSRSNRRSLRRFLHSGARTGWEFAKQHPNTEGWRRRHPRFQLDGWLEGVAVAGDVPKVGRVEIRFEEDPYEILKLGTYVGSCLGLGGCNSHSAAAVLLDVNKRVAFARTAEGGRFVGRQLVAVSENDELVCYSVYPHVASPELKQLFAMFDEAIAWKLGLPLHRPQEKRAYQIAPVIAPVYYDDGAWDVLEAVSEPQ